MTTETVVPADPQHYIWWFPGSPVKVHLHLQVVQQLQERIQNAPSAPEEGLLFGRIRNGITEILEFQPAANATVANIIAALPNERLRSLMGYYRTEEKETFHLTAKDLALSKKSLTQPYHVFLMIQATGFGTPNATFFFHDGDRHMSDFAFLEFPFDRSLLATEEHDRMQRSKQSAAEELIAPPLPAPVPVVTGPRSKQTLVKVTWLVAAGVLASGMWFNRNSLREWRAQVGRLISHPSATGASSQSSSLSSMALHATRRDGDLELTWNRESAVISAAVSGVISIQDGDSKRLVTLDALQLRSGSLLYSPISEQVVMQLSVKTPAETMTGSVMVVLPNLGGLQTYSLAVPTAPSAAEPATPPSGDVPLAKASKPFIPSLSANGPSPAPPLLQDPPTLKITPVTSTPVLDATSQALVPPPPVAGMATLQQPSPDIATYDLPTPITKVSPLFPRELQNLSVKQTVQIKVTIDKNGRVTKVEPLPGNVSKFLVNSAVDAARLWKFQPARRNHMPVSSESLLQFDFNHR